MIAKVRIIFQIAMKKREKLLADALFSCKMQSRGTSEGEFDGNVWRLAQLAKR